MSEKPNIIVFFTDQQRWDTCGCYGNPMGLTPNLDGLARRGVRFENAFTCQPVCGPARACLQTGRYATANGVFTNGIPLPHDQPLLARCLSDTGYDVGYIGKFHLSDVRTDPVERGTRAGYDGFWEAADVLEFTSRPYEGRIFDVDDKPIEFNGLYRTHFLTDRAIRFLDIERSEPFFLFLSYIEPHFQNDMRHFVGPDGSKQRYANPWVPEDLRGKPGDWYEELPDYYGCVASLDDCLGRVVQHLEATGRLANTVIVFTSDHGCHFCTRNNEYKRSCHESSIRIPMVVAGPGFSGGTVIEQLVSLIDLPPTLLDAASVDRPETFAGRSMLPLAAGEREDWPDEVFVQISETEVGRAIRTEQWKYSVFAPEKDPWMDPGSDVYVERYLYDLKADPHESVNLIGREGYYREVADELMERLKKRMVAAGEEEPVIERARHYA